MSKEDKSGSSSPDNQDLNQRNANGHSGANSELEKGLAESVAAEIAALKEDATENHEKYLRALADLDNYKKRAIKERSDLIRYQGEQVIVDLLEVVDNFERALASDSSEKDQLKTGIEMIYKQLIDLLTKNGVKGESSVGKPFNPETHQALSQIESEGVAPGCVVSELKKTYFYKDKLIRIGQVVVAASEKAKSAEAID